MKKINPNYIALTILVIAYIFSAGRFFSIAGYFSPSDGTGSSKNDKTIRVTHWQLEPGYREALDWAIAQYNELPHVKEAGIHVEQAPITEKVYNQFMNVHLISGTAPDIAAKGQTNLIRGNAVARYYTPLGDYINDPNPYNAPEYLGQSTDPELAEYLAEAPWKDTFIDGMLGGYDESLDDYYAVPISTWGGVRLFYNGTMLANIKTYIKKAMAQNPQPQWLQDCWYTVAPDGKESGYLPDNQRLHAWLDSDDTPDSLGQLMLYCEAVRAYAKENNISFLVPISGSNYSASNLGLTYMGMFQMAYAEELEGPIGSGVDSFETYVGWETGVWSFDSRPMTEAFDFGIKISQFFPTGFQGLDREQAQRRFILGNAALISSGGWDAAGIFKGVANRDNPEDIFEVKISAAPLPAEDERWADLIPYRRSEADTKAGVPLAINKQSKNFDWALDFLRYITSMRVNEEINQRAAWISAIVGADTVEHMKGFDSIPEGLPPNYTMNFAGTAAIGTQWGGNSKLVLTGDIPYSAFAERMNEFLASPRLGMMNYWFRQRQDELDRSKARDRSVSVEGFTVLFNNDPKAAARQRSLFYDSLLHDEAVHIESRWHEIYPDEPFPKF